MEGRGREVKRGRGEARPPPKYFGLELSGAAAGRAELTTTVL